MTSQAHSRGPTDAGLTARVLSSEWQPIETAPRDGTWFVIANFDPDWFTDGEFEVGRYNPLVGSNFEQLAGDLYRKVEYTAYEWTGFNNFHRATHWMPLPTPPGQS